MGVKNKKGCQIEKRKKSYRHQKRVSNSKKNKKKRTTVRRPRQRSSSPSCCRSSCHSWCCWLLLRGVVLLSVVAAGCGCGVVLLFCFCVRGCCAFAIYYLVGLCRVSPTPTMKKTKKDAIPPWPAMAKAAAIRNPQRHRYLVAFFSKFRHAFPPWPPFDNTACDFMKTWHMS